MKLPTPAPENKIRGPNVLHESVRGQVLASLHKGHGAKASVASLFVKLLLSQVLCKYFVEHAVMTKMENTGALKRELEDTVAGERRAIVYRRLAIAFCAIAGIFVAVWVPRHFASDKSLDHIFQLGGIVFSAFVFPSLNQISTANKRILKCRIAMDRLSRASSGVELKDAVKYAQQTLDWALEVA